MERHTMIFCLLSASLAVNVSCDDRPRSDSNRSGSTSLLAAPLSMVEREARRERIREYFRARQAKRPVVATTMTSRGTVIDWLPRTATLTRPDDIPRSNHTGKPNRDWATSAPRFELDDQLDARGPAGTVPHARFDVEGYLNAAGDALPADPRRVFDSIPKPAPESTGYYYTGWKTTGSYRAGKGLINIWDVPQVVSGESSIAQIGMARGSGSNKQTVEAGKIENAFFNSGAPTFFTYFTTVGYGSEDDCVGGWNTLVEGFQQVHPYWFPGMTLPSSTSGGSQLDTLVMVNRDSSGNWWVSLQGEQIGYYPYNKDPDCSGSGTMFSSSGIRDEASLVVFQGEISRNLSSVATSTDMGSAQFSGQWWQYAAFIRDMEAATSVYGTDFFFFHDVAGTRSTQITDSACYDQNLQTFSSGYPWRNYFFYGGPGDEASGCN